ncbi:helix-turn-helix transcriptional regulator [Sphingomonadaceae bacterium OTU29THOMA1]|uniref:helix-turn-helix domain-containing protein n=1 Tax=Sphingomonas sp. Leaf37 TaxID=2876552 RepID=UPI001E4F98EF|nr:helix-turn-helix transcriptional regulator [Sphingomonas sp. Leaf37]USU04389.1 helix-turn-helix transcriptional regulator [Sphingomonadaceae bacterium OTU29LAMAA1]USU11510.1 helix-turn-helix transcriptional regulator [Sphingomonadaceae bacterium OTU29THOMA1]
MPVEITLDAVLSKRRMTGKELARRVGLSETQLSLFRSGKVRGLRFSTLSRMCAVLDCAPGELLSYAFDPADLSPLATDDEV